MNSNLLGDYGEIIASRYLRKHGYFIVTANYSCRLGEIDLIAEDKKYICFVEVKTRSENMKYAPSDAVDIIKRTKIIASSQLFLKALCSKDSHLVFPPPPHQEILNILCFFHPFKPY